MEPWKKASLTVAPPEVTRPSTGWVLVRLSDRLVCRLCRGERIFLGHLVKDCTDIPRESVKLWRCSERSTFIGGMQCRSL
jgi:hypothetical protein